MLDKCGKCLYRQFYICMEEEKMATEKLYQIAARVTGEEKDRLLRYCEDNDLSMS